MPDDINIENYCENIKDRLELKLAADITAEILDIEVMPETAGGYKRPIKKKGRISICYLDTDFDKLKSISGQVIQDEYNKFGLFLVSKSLYGAGGIYDLYAKSRKWLIGFRILNHEKLIAKKAELKMRENDTALWFMLFEVSGKATLVEYNDDPPAVSITRMTFKPPVGTGADVVVDENTQTGSNPINP
jgi:hypothetical protein